MYSVGEIVELRQSGDQPYKYAQYGIVRDVKGVWRVSALKGKHECLIYQVFTRNHLVWVVEAGILCSQSSTKHVKDKRHLTIVSERV